MAYRIIPRREWGAAPAESVTPSDPAKLRGGVLHWFGKPRARARHADCPAQLRAVQRAHMEGEFSDIAYNHGVCQHGAIYTLRGFKRRTGANGTPETNRTRYAVVVMIGEGDHPTPRALSATKWLLGEWTRRGAKPSVWPHARITGSECPGRDLKRWLAAGRPT